jgi:hypothetical protein
MSLLAFAASAAMADTQDLPNYQQVNNFLARGGAPSTKGVQMLHDRHIGMVIDTRVPGPGSTDEQREVERLKMEYLSMPIGTEVPTDQQVSRFVQTVDSAQPKENMDWIPGVYVHGEQGKHGANCLVAIWRVTRDHWPYKRAMVEAQRHGMDKEGPLANKVKEYADGAKKL